MDSGMDSPKPMTTDILIRTQNLTKQFADHIAVNQVCLEIGKGEVYGLIGANGAGKTTLIRMLATAEEPSAGEIWINGINLTRSGHNPELKRQIGFLPDDFPLYDDLEVWDYLDYFARLYFLRDRQRQQRIAEVIEVVNLTEKARSSIANLSRGMRQRLSLARSIIHQPTVLLLDEPVSGLDPSARVEARQTIKSLQSQGMTILVSSHILSDLEEICTAIGIMERGKLIESSKLQDIYQRSNQSRIQVVSIDPVFSLLHFLAEYPLVSGVEVSATNPQLVSFQFSGDSQAVAHLLRSMISAGLSICDFHPTQESLEDIFLKTHGAQHRN
jgi:ABC-2 type transport system ATP-binding protein